MKPRIGAVVVLYFPHLEELRRLLASLPREIARVYVIDNSPEGSRLGADELVTPMPVEYFAAGRNLGIASAQNLGIAKAIEDGCSHVLLLDQDSFMHPEVVRQLLEGEEFLLKQGARVAAVGPCYLDRKTGASSPALRSRWFSIEKVKIDPGVEKPVATDYLIASGSLIRVSVLKEVGFMRDDLFIDWVDIEWAHRAKARGFQCFLVPHAHMEHSLGEDAFTLFGRNFHVHSEIRNYYYLRNALYLMRLASVDRKWKSAYMLKAPMYSILFIALAENKRKGAALVYGAVRDAFKGKLGEYSV